MAKRFVERVGIQPSSVSTGFVQGQNTLLNRLQSFGQATDRLTTAVEAQRGQKEAQKVELEKVEGITQAPEKKKAGVFETVLTGGVSTKQYNKSLETAYLASLGRDLSEGIAAIEAENPASITQFNEKAGGFISGVLKGVDPAVKDQVANYAQNQISNSRVRVHRKTIQKNKQNAADESKVSVNSFANESARLSREGNKIGAAEAITQSFTIIDGMIEAGDMSAVEGANMKREIEREASEQSIRGNFDLTVENEGADAAIEQLDKLEGKIPKGWTPDEWDTFIRSERASLNQDRVKQAKARSELTIEQSREISNLKIQASTGTGDAGKIVQRTESLFNEGKINASERTSILTNVVNDQKKAIKKSQDYSLVADRLSGNDGIVVDEKTINGFYQENMLEQLEQLPPELKLQQQAFFVEKMKHVPTAMKNEITTQLRSGNSELIANASRLIDRIDETPGLIDRSFTAHDRAFAEQVVSLSANLEPEEAVKIANELTDPTNQSRIDAVKNTIKSEKLANDYPSIVQDAFNPFGPFEGTQVGEIALPQMTKEYKDLFEAHYEAGMSEDAAKDKALSLLKRNWKKSEVTGEVMKYPPDDYYSVAGDVDYIKVQLTKDVNDEFLFDESVTSDQVFLQATEGTARTASQGEPEYRVMIVKDGSITPLYGFSWKPDMQSQIDKVEKRYKGELMERRGETGKVPKSASTSLEKFKTF